MNKDIINCLIWFVNRMSDGFIHDMFEDEPKVKDIKEAITDMYEELKKHIDFTKLTREEAEELGFGVWDDKSDLMLFPLWLVPLIPEGLEVTTISGITSPYHKGMDNNIGFGYVAYGIYIKINCK